MYVPQYKVGSVRVTHPCAGRHQEQAPMLPLDLHVLSLPLAFILSQDQTLHSIALYSDSDHSEILMSKFVNYSLTLSSAILPK